MNAAVKQRHGLEGFHLAGQAIRRSIDRLYPASGGGFILGIATAVGSIVKRNAEYNEQRCKETDHRPCESRNCLAAPGERSSPRAANSLRRLREVPVIVAQKASFRDQSDGG